MRIHEHYNNRVAKWFLGFMNKISVNGGWERWGITVFNHIFYSSSGTDEKHRAHERVHINQVFFSGHYSWLLYYPKYFWYIISGYFKYGNLLEAYTRTPFEDEAYKLQSDSRFAPYVYDRAFRRKIPCVYFEMLLVLAIIVFVIIL